MDSNTARNLLLRFSINVNIWFHIYHFKPITIKTCNTWLVKKFKAFLIVSICGLNYIVNLFLITVPARLFHVNLARSWLGANASISNLKPPDIRDILPRHKSRRERVSTALLKKHRAHTSLATLSLCRLLFSSLDSDLLTCHTPRECDAFCIQIGFIHAYIGMI